MTDAAGMGEADDLRLLRRDLDRQYHERLAHLETRLEHIERRVDEELIEARQVMEYMTRQMQKLLDKQRDYEPAMAAMVKVIHSGMVMRWVVLFVVTTLAAIGTGATAWEAMQKVIK